MTLNPVSDTLIAHLRAQLPEDAVRQPEPRYLEEPRGKFFGADGVLVLPRSAEEVSTVLRACNASRVGVVPFGGGTGLVGGQVLDNGPAPVILSLERMNRIRAVYPGENVIVAEAGAILADLQDAAIVQDRLFPLSLASEGSARIGGNLATNAGGVNVLRYGNARDLCLGLEAVLPNGDVWHGLTRLRKDNTGYDLRNLLVGSEGTLGVITAAALKLFPQPADIGTALLVVKNPEAALGLLARARDALGEAVSAFELMHRQGLEFLAEKLPDVRQPFADLPEWCVLIEVGMSAGQSAQGALESLFSDALEAGLITDGLIAQSGAQRDAFWSVREHIPQANKRVGSVSSHDVSLPLSVIPEFIVKGHEVVGELGDFRINCFGHLGDGNLHYNVFPPAGQSRESLKHLGGDVQQAVHDLVCSMGGSFSAEHGIGRLKTGDLERYGDPTRLAAMRAIKAALDPNGIMNPGAVLG